MGRFARVKARAPLHLNLLFFCDCSNQVRKHVLPGGASRRAEKITDLKYPRCSQRRKWKLAGRSFCEVLLVLRCFPISHVAQRHLLPFSSQSSNVMAHFPRSMNVYPGISTTELSAAASEGFARGESLMVARVCFPFTSSPAPQYLEISSRSTFIFRPHRNYLTPHDSRPLY